MAGRRRDRRLISLDSLVASCMITGSGQDGVSAGWTIVQIHTGPVGSEGAEVGETEVDRDCVQGRILRAGWRQIRDRGWFLKEGGCCFGRRSRGRIRG
jgi:hypothetical protein